MARKNFGSLHGGNYAIQPDWDIIEKNDGTIEGTMLIECDNTAIFTLPKLYDSHPYDTRVHVYERKLTRLRSGKTMATLSFFGLQSDPTPKFIQYPGTSGQDAIQTHPNFATFAGTPAAPLNGAKFSTDEQTEGEFLGFFDPTNRKYGVRAYIVPTIDIQLSYWTYKRPTTKKLTKIFTNIPGIVEPQDVADWLLVGQPIRQIGKAYQVTEQYSGSGSLGWDSDIYTST
jgi:hypothetical protein